MAAKPNNRKREPLPPLPVLPQNPAPLEPPPHQASSGDAALEKRLEHFKKTSEALAEPEKRAKTTMELAPSLHHKLQILSAKLKKKMWELQTEAVVDLLNKYELQPAHDEGAAAGLPAAS